MEKHTVCFYVKALTKTLQMNEKNRERASEEERERERM